MPAFKPDTTIASFAADDKAPALLVSVADACRMLGIRKSKLYELVYAGQITKVKCGGKALVTVASINALVAPTVPQRARAVKASEGPKS